MKSDVRKSLADWARTATTQRELDEIESLLNQANVPDLHNSPPNAENGDPRAKHAEYMRKRRAGERDLKLPTVKNPSRRKNAESNPALFLRTYFPHKFYREFTANQMAIIEELQHRIKYGGDKAIADSRGGGKTTLVEGMAGAYGPLTGALRFPVILAATGSDAENILANIKAEYETNDLLAEDYPEVCLPVRDLNGAPQAAGTQTVGGVRTRIKWSGAVIQFPTVVVEWCPACYSEGQRSEVRGSEVRSQRSDGKRNPTSETLTSETLISDPLNSHPLVCAACGRQYRPYLSQSAGASFSARGVDGSIRGMRRGAERPDFVLLDDVETEEVAGSLHQVSKLEQKIENAVGGLAGPDKRLARVFLCTIQNNDCLAARYTDPRIKPGFSGVRFRQVERWPDKKDLWERYIELRQDGKRSGEDLDGRQATAFYAQNRKAMGKGVKVANPYRYVTAPGEDGEPLELSAIQHVHNRAADFGWDYVFCELQNEPPEPPEMGGLPKFDDLLRRHNHHTQWQAPPDVQTITAHIDCGAEVLWWCVTGWTYRFGGYVLAYGTFPDQRRKYFTKDEISPTLAAWHKHDSGGAATTEEVLYAALRRLTEHLFEQPIHAADGTRHEIARMGIDAGWKTETVYRFCRQSPRGALVVPTKGEGVQAKQLPMLQRKLRPGERRGSDVPWRYVYPEHRRQKLLEMDVNWLKEFVHDRLSMPLGGTAPITFYGDESVDHRQFAAHLLAERRTLVSTEWRSKHEYTQKVGADNDWLDTLVGCAAVAAFEGVSVDGRQPEKPKAAKWFANQRRRRR